MYHSRVGTLRRRRARSSMPSRQWNPNTIGAWGETAAPPNGVRRNKPCSLIPARSDAAAAAGAAPRTGRTRQPPTGQFRSGRKRGSVTLVATHRMARKVAYCWRRTSQYAASASRPNASNSIDPGSATFGTQRPEVRILSPRPSVGIGRRSNASPRASPGHQPLTSVAALPTGGESSSNRFRSAPPRTACPTTARSAGTTIAMLAILLLLHFTHKSIIIMRRLAGRSG